MKNDKPAWMGINNKAILMIRVSGRGQAENTSFTSQQGDGQIYAKTMGLDVVKVFKVVESAKDSAMRTQYKAAFKWADDNGVRHRIFDRGDREARNLTDIEDNEKSVRRDEIVLHYAREFKVFHKDSSDSDFLARDYGAVNHKHYSRELSGKVRRGTLTKAREGHYPHNYTPPGYAHQKRKDENGRELRRGTIVVPHPDPRERKRVVRCFEMRDKHNWSSTIVRKQLMVEGLILPHEASRFSRMRIERIWDYDVHGKFYLGLFDWNGIEYQGKHELFVPQDLARRVILGRKRRAYGKVDDGVLSGGWLKCGCGCNIVYDPKKKVIQATGETREYRYYHCTNGKGAHASLKGLSITEDFLFEEFSTAVSALNISDSFAKDIVDALNETQKAAQTAIKGRSGDFKEALKKLDASEHRAWEAYEEGVLDKDGYKRRLEKIRDQRAEFTQLLEAANLEISDASMETVKSVLELATDAESLWKHMTPRERREYLDQVVSNQVLEAGRVRFDLQKPFSVLSNFKENSKWRSL